METKPPSFAEKLIQFLSYAEVGALLLAFLGLSLAYLHYSGSRQFILLGFSALSVTYFLTAFTLPAISVADEQTTKPQGFVGLFTQTILRKVMYLGCSVGIVGLLFGFLGLKGDREMLLIGASTLIASCVFGGLAILRNGETMKFLQAPLLRALPLGFLSASWLFTH